MRLYVAHLHPQNKSFWFFCGNQMNCLNNNQTRFNAFCSDTVMSVSSVSAGNTASSFHCLIL